MVWISIYWTTKGATPLHRAKDAATVEVYTLYLLTTTTCFFIVYYRSELSGNTRKNVVVERGTLEKLQPILPKSQTYEVQLLDSSTPYPA